MLTLKSDLEVSFEHLVIKFQSILDEHRDQLEEIVRKTVDDFDFEEILQRHIKYKIEEGIEKAFSEIDLSDSLKTKIWNEIEKRVDI